LSCRCAEKTHAVVTGGNTFCYDCNGNMTGRTIDGVTYTLTYNAENRLKSVTQGSQTITFTYDGDACPELVEGGGW